MSEKPNLLYIDDEDANLLLFEIGFRSSFNVYTAQTAGDAMQIMKDKGDIDIVISDMRMPGMTGMELIKAAYALYPDIKYYLLSGTDLDSETTDMLDNKMLSGFFTKPLNIEQIIRQLQEE